MKISFNFICLISSVLIASIFLLFPLKVVNNLNEFISYLLFTFDTTFLYVVSFILIFCIALTFSPWGTIKLGDTTPEFSTFSWIAMLFAAGMGSGLIFWGVAEPLYHLKAPINEYASLLRALSITNFHWGLHAWAIYAFSGLIIAYFSYNKKREMTISGTLSSSTNIWIKTIDLLGVFSILFGVAGTLANSIALIQTGFENIYSGFDYGMEFRVILLLIIAVIFTFSSLTGLDKGVKILSNFNVIIAFLLLAFVLFFTGFIPVIKQFILASIDYIKVLSELSFIIHDDSAKWSQGWTIIYFLWWIAWAPFTGLFIARISKGRTIREFLISVIIFPTIITILWFVVFGGGASHFDNYNLIQEAVQNDYTKGIFMFFENFPFTKGISILAILLLITFVITSADSAIFVTVLLTGRDSKINKIVWSFVMVGISIALIYQNNVDLNKVIAITGAIPFVVILILQGIIFMKSLFDDKKDIFNNK